MSDRKRPPAPPNAIASARLPAPRFGREAGRLGDQADRFLREVRTA
jgi:hypothetical protein